MKKFVIATGLAMLTLASHSQDYILQNKMQSFKACHLCIAEVSVDLEVAVMLAFLQNPGASFKSDPIKPDPSLFPNNFQPSVLDWSPVYHSSVQQRTPQRRLSSGQKLLSGAVGIGGQILQGGLQVQTGH